MENSYDNVPLKARYYMNGFFMTEIKKPKHFQNYRHGY